MSQRATHLAARSMSKSKLNSSSKHRSVSIKTALAKQNAIIGPRSLKPSLIRQSAQELCMSAQALDHPDCFYNPTFHGVKRPGQGTVRRSCSDLWPKYSSALNMLGSGRATMRLIESKGRRQRLQLLRYQSGDMRSLESLNSMNSGFACDRG